MSSLRKALLALVGVALCAVSAQAQTYIGESHTDNANTTTVVVSRSPTAGRALVVKTAMDRDATSTTTIVGVTTNGGGATCTAAGFVQPTGSVFGAGAFVCLNIPSSITQITMTFSAAIRAGVVVEEWSGVGSIGNNTTNTTTSGTFTLTPSGSPPAVSSVISTNTTGFTATATVGTLNVQFFTSNQGNVSTASMYNAAGSTTTATFTSQAWSGVAVGLNAATATAPCTRQLLGVGCDAR